MPSETPQGIMSRTPPRSRESDMPSRCASRSQTAFSSAALAMGLPRTDWNIFGHSPPCSTESTEASIGPSSWTMICQAVPVDSPEKKGRSPAVHSPQPVRPSDWISIRRILRSRVTPKLVSNGRTRGMCSSRRTMLSILISFSVDPYWFDAKSRLGEWSQFEDSISVCIPGEAKYGLAPCECLLKLFPVLQLNGESTFPVFVGCLPFVNGGWDQDSFLDLINRRMPRKCCNYPGRVEFPLGQQTVGWQTTLQSTR